MIPVTQNLSMVRGDTLMFDVFFKGIDLDSITGLYFTCKKRPVVPDEEAVFQKSFEDGITPIADHNGWRVRVAPADTYDVDKGTYYYDLQMVLNDKDVYTLMMGNLQIEQDVTGVTV